MAFDPNHDDVVLTKPLDDLAPGPYMYCPQSGDYHPWDEDAKGRPWCGYCGQTDRQRLIINRAHEEATR
jgi:hypothetical protein